MKSLHLIGSLGAVLALSLAACGSGSSETTSPTDPVNSPDTSAAVGETKAEANATTDPPNSAFPLTFDNCGESVTITESPQRIVLLEVAAVSLLESVDALDRVVSRTGDYATEYFSDETNAKIEQIPALTSQTSSTGGVEISLETIIDSDPDLVIGYETETITRDGLANAGINLYVIPPYCDVAPPVSFESIYNEVRFYGTLFESEGLADLRAAELEAAVDGYLADPVAGGETAAALYVSADGSALYAYSALGMVHPQMEALGLVNVFAELPERVPEVSIEEIIDRNPQVLILLYTDASATPEQITALVTGLPGADAIDAIATGRIIPLLFNFSEPPSPLVIDGLAILAERLSE